MIQPPPRQATPPARTARRKVAVEIYFILYLSAIVLLLGTSPTHHGSGDDQETADAAIAALLTPDFRLSAERIQLVYTESTATPTASSPTLPHRRDTVNGITAHGRFSAVEFRIVSIDDSSEGSEQQPGRTSLVPDAANHARFSWQPPKVARPTSWRVRIEGIAQPLPPPTNLDPALRARTIESLRRHGPVRDTVEFVLTTFPAGTDGRIIAATIARGDSAGGDSNSGRTPLGIPALPLPGQSFALSLNNSEVRVPPGREWRNVVNIFGVDARRVTVTAPNARIIVTSANTIELVGTAPSTGTQTVTVEATAPGGSSASARFNVAATPMKIPSLPERMFTGQQYRIDMESPGLENDLTVDIVENGKLIRTAAPQFPYTPTSNGGVVTFERKMGGVRVDRYECTIAPLPAPVISDQQRSGSSMTFTTRSYGTVNGRPNLALLKILRGNNVDDPVEIGSPRIDPTTLEIVQQWRVPLRTPQVRRQEFDVWVIDQRGSALSTKQTIVVPEQ